MKRTEVAAYLIEKRFADQLEVRICRLQKRRAAKHITGVSCAFLNV